MWGYLLGIGEIFGEGILDDEALAEYTRIGVAVPIGSKANSTQRLDELFAHGFGRGECIVGFHGAEAEEEVSGMN